MPINWVDVPDPKNPPAGAPKLSAANLARLALIEDIGTAGTPTGDALKAAYVAKGALVFNVRDYGAKGDGSTDDSTAILAAINAASGQPVYLAAGNYAASLSLTDQDIHLIGPGRLVHQQGKGALTVQRTLGPALAVSSVGTVQLGASNPSTGVTETASTVNVGANVVGITQGDLFLLNSQDQYPWTGGLATITGNASTPVWRNAYVLVHGIGLTVNLTGTISEGAQITGATSGAMGRVLSIAATATAGVSTVVLSSISAAFANGENVQVGGTTQGTASGAAFVIAAGLLDDTYTTSPVMRKVPTGGKCVIDGPEIIASGDVDSLVGSANRVPALVLKGVYGARVRTRIRSAWSRAVVVASCYGGYFEADIDKLPNNANTAEGAYGYGVEFTGATERCTAVVRGGNCRHGFTTNVIWGGYQFLDPTDMGVPKYNVVRDSHIRGAISASFDTHWGAYYTTFINCVSVRSQSGDRYSTSSQGFQNRGFGTSYINCRDDGSVVSFVEASGQLDAGFPHVLRYRGCVADNYQLTGFQQANDMVSDAAKFEWINCEARGDGSTVNLPYVQYGLETRNGNHLIERFISRRFNGAPMRHTASGGRLDIVDCYADYYECPGNTAGLRFDSTPTELHVRNWRVRGSRSSTTAPVSIFRVAGGTIVMDLDGYSFTGGIANPPLVSVTGGSITINPASNNMLAVAPVTNNGDANINLTPRVSSPVQVFNTPLTVARTVTLSTSSGVPINGDSFRVVRTAAATGASTLTVAGKALAVSQWADVVYDGSAWQVAATGSL